MRALLVLWWYFQISWGTCMVLIPFWHDLPSQICWAFEWVTPEREQQHCVLSVKSS